MPVTAIYAGVLGLILFALSVRVIGRRRDVRAGIGDGGDKQLQRRIRTHANFTEYVPMILLLMIVAESLKAPAMALHVVGVLTIVGRLLHIAAFTLQPEPAIIRVLAMSSTFFALLTGAALCLWRALT